MNIKKVNKLLKKINNLHQSILDDDSISSIEKELFLSYVKSLYEAAIDGEDNDNQSSSGKKKNKKSNPKTLEPTVVPTPIKVEKTILDELEEEKVVEVKKIEKVEVELEPIATPEPIIEKEKAIQNETPVNIKDEITGMIMESDGDKSELMTPLYDNMSELFVTLEVKELSTKLANSPIKSIKSKLGINEKLLTVKELFSSDTAIYNKTIDALDNMSSFEEARIYLAENIVDKFDWMNDSKFKKALRFVQLVQRRYL